MTNQEKIDRAMLNLGEACRPVLKQFQQATQMIRELNERPDFQFLVMWIRAKQGVNNVNRQ